MTRVADEGSPNGVRAGSGTPSVPEGAVGTGRIAAASMRDEDPRITRRALSEITAFYVICFGVVALCSHAAEQCMSGVWLAYQPHWEPYFARLEQPLLTASALTAASVLLNVWDGAFLRAALCTAVSVILGALAFRAVGYAASCLFGALPLCAVNSYAPALRARHAVAFRRVLTRAGLSGPKCGSAGWPEGAPPVGMGSAGPSWSSMGLAVHAGAAGSSSRGSSTGGRAKSGAPEEEVKS